VVFGFFISAYGSSPAFSDCGHTCPLDAWTEVVCESCIRYGFTGREMSGEQQIRNHASFIWSVADKLRGVYKQSEYGRVILPLVVLRRLDCVLEPTRADVLARFKTLKGMVENVEPVLCSVSGEQFYNVSPLDFPRLLDDPTNVAGNLRSYIAGFSPAAREVIEKFGFDAQITRLAEKNLLYLVVSQFAEIDLHPNVVSNLEMGYLYEELLRKFSELSNEEAGHHFTPREVIRLMVNLLFVEDDDLLRKPGVVRTLFDPACGTGGMLSIAEDWLRELNPEARLEVFGQELNDETYAVCRSDMMLKGQDASHIVSGNSFSEDGHAGRTFDYMLANPPFGVEWKSVERVVKDEYSTLGFRGRFGAGLPPINDGSFLFLQHMISKMKPVEEGGSRIAIVFNGSPLFTGGAGSGPSEIRRWIIENDWLEAVVALPDQLFYNTGIFTYFWVVTNRKSAERRGKVQLLDARESWVKMRKSLGEKRKEISPEQTAEITRLYGTLEESERVKILPNEAFGYQRITVEQPLRIRYSGEGASERLEASKSFAKLPDDQREQTAAAIVGLAGLSTVDRKEALAAAAAENGKLSRAEEKALIEALAVRDPEAPALDEPDTKLRDQENDAIPEDAVTFERDPSARLKSEPYRRAVEEYMAGEVLRYVPDAWADHAKTRVGYEIPLTWIFYRYEPPRSLSEIDADIRAVNGAVEQRLSDVAT
jgi:type I restriction enzyme M protein